MAEQLEWRRGFPRRALRRLGWFTLPGSAVACLAWLLFGNEPDRLASDEPNPLALIPLATILLAAAGLVPLLIPVVRRPRLLATHYELAVRPGALRTLRTPWAGVAEVAGVRVNGNPLLLVRCVTGPGRTGDRPRWVDQAVLRRAGRGAPVAYHLAVRMDEFTGPPVALLTALASWAPRHVHFLDRLGT